MTLYGLYTRDPAAGNFVWFTTDKAFKPGAYRRGRHQHGQPDVYLAESIPALILQVGPVIEQAEVTAQSSLGTADMSADSEQRIEGAMTEGLLAQLTETSDIWEPNPRWVHDLRPAKASGE